MSDTSQSYANHKRYVVGFHGVTFVLIVVLLVWSITLLIGAFSWPSVMQLVTVLALLMLGWYCRVFALAAQDRVIRLEEQLRLVQVLPPEMKSRVPEIKMGQLIALRFASDGELAGLVRRIIAGELTTPDSIKRAIQSWRPDHYRA